MSPSVLKAVCFHIRIRRTRQTILGGEYLVDFLPRFWSDAVVEVYRVLPIRAGRGGHGRLNSTT